MRPIIFTLTLMLVLPGLTSGQPAKKKERVIIQTVLGDHPELDFNGNLNPDRQGFAAFDKTEGIKRIHSIQAHNQYLPEPVQILKIIRADI